MCGPVVLLTLLAGRSAGGTKTVVKNFKQNKSKQKWGEIKQKKQGGSEDKFVIKGKVHTEGNKNNKRCESEENNFENKVRCLIMLFNLYGFVMVVVCLMYLDGRRLVRCCCRWIVRLASDHWEYSWS